MERDRLLQRRVYPEVAPRVEYQLTRGKTLEPVIDAMCAWGTEQLRTRFANIVESASRIFTSNSAPLSKHNNRAQGATEAGSLSPAFSHRPFQDKDRKALR